MAIQILTVNEALVVDSRLIAEELGIERADNIRDKVILTMLYSLGLQTNEIIKLRWGDIIGNIIAVYRNGDDVLYLDLSDHIQDILSQLPKESELIFLSYRGKPLTRNAVHNLVKKYAKKANLDKSVSCLWLRNSYNRNKTINLAKLP